MNHIFQLPYGNSIQNLTVPDGLVVEGIYPSDFPAASDAYGTVYAALFNSPDLDIQRLKTAKTIAIAVNDKTRPVPHKEILTPLLEFIHRVRGGTNGIQFWIATGSHQPMNGNEIAALLPDEIVTNYPVWSHDIDNHENLIHLGSTTRGTPVIVNRQFLEADYKIVTGDIEPHHFAGFSGGYKTAAIGLAGRETVNHNHAMLTDPLSWIGVYEQNPLRQDINEIGMKIGVDLALNTILNHQKGIIAAVAGHPLTVMLRGIPLSRQACGSPCSGKFDIVIASAGGHPKDINFYQAQKALTHASLFCKPGGSLVLVAACPEGSGSASYEKFMRGVGSVLEVYSKFSQSGFIVGPHKAFQVARLLEQFSITLVSEMPASLVSSLLMSSAKTAQDALESCLHRTRQSPRVAILPHATTTLPLHMETVSPETGL